MKKNYQLVLNTIIDNIQKDKKTPIHYCFTAVVRRVQAMF